VAVLCFVAKHKLYAYFGHGKNIEIKGVYVVWGFLLEGEKPLLVRNGLSSVVFCLNLNGLFFLYLQ
jgi:hypothetical protein